MTLARIGLGTVTLALLARARTPVDREDWGRIALLGTVWMAIPLTLFPIAQQWIDSSVAGMINGAMPIFAAAWSAYLLRRLPGWRQMLGIGIGFLGIVLVFLPELQASADTALGALVALFAVTFYGLATNLAVPLQQKYGAAPVVLRAQLVALLLVLPFGLWQLGESTWSWESALAMIPLGVLGTGLAIVLMATLAGRVGAPRASIAIYFLPLVAVVLGVVVLGETRGADGAGGCGPGPGGRLDRLPPRALRNAGRRSADPRACARSVDPERSMQRGALPFGQALRGLAQDDHAQHVVLGDVVLVDGAHELALEHDADAVRQVEDVVDVVADEEDADALALQLKDEVADLRRLRRAEGRRRLVHDEDLGVEVDGAGDGHRLTLAAGERLHRRLEVLEAGVEPAHHLSSRRLHGRVVQRAQAGHELPAQEDVGGGIHVVGQGQGLVDGLDAVASWRRAGCRCGPARR